MVRRRTRFLRSEAGISLTEGLIVFPFMIMLVAVIVELGAMVHQWNLAAKAMHLGVRKLIVSNPAVPAFNTTFASNPNLGGQLMNADATVTDTCTGAAGADPCDPAVMNTLVNGSAAWPGLANFFPGITAQQIRITYTRNGLGYHGRPAGPVVTVRMEVANLLASRFPVLDALANFAGIPFPPFTVTATSEDLKSCRDVCS